MTIGGPVKRSSGTARRRHPAPVMLLVVMLLRVLLAAVAGHVLARVCGPDGASMPFYALPHPSITFYPIPLSGVWPWWHR